MVLQTTFDPEDSLRRFMHESDSGRAWTLHATATLVRTRALADRTDDLDTLRANAAGGDEAGTGSRRKGPARPELSGIQTLWPGEGAPG